LVASLISSPSKSGPLLSSSTAPSGSDLRSTNFGFSSAQYNSSMYSFQRFLTSSSSVNKIPLASLMVTLCLTPVFVVLVISFTLAYIRSDLPLFNNKHYIQYLLVDTL